MIMESLELLGRRGKDKITGTEGVITSVVFDLFGCIQISLNPGLDKDEKQREICWYDVSRITISLLEERVMDAPKFDAVPRQTVADYAHGSAEKPKARS